MSIDRPLGAQILCIIWYLYFFPLLSLVKIVHELYTWVQLRQTSSYKLLCNITNSALAPREPEFNNCLYNSDTSSLRIHLRVGIISKFANKHSCTTKRHVNYPEFTNGSFGRIPHSKALILSTRSTRLAFAIWMIPTRSLVIFVTFVFFLLFLSCTVFSCVCNFNLNVL